MQADMARGRDRQSYLPQGFYALNSLLYTSNNQADKFRAKNFLLTPDAFETLVMYCYFYLFGVKKCAESVETSLTLWRNMNILFVHPISCNIALKKLSDDQTSGKNKISKLLTQMMNSDGLIPDNIEGLIYQTIALIDIQSDENVDGITEGVDKITTIGKIVNTSYLKQMYEQMAKPLAKDHIKLQKIRL
jgi:hypothetical protein